MLGAEVVQAAPS